LLLNNWSTARVARNVFSAPPGNAIVALDQTQASLVATWDDNRYVHSATDSNFLINATGFNFPDWQTVTGYDQNSVFTADNLTGVTVFVRPNRYETGRANIVVYNWDYQSSVNVDVSSVLTPGAAYEVRNVQDFFGPPVMSGVFDGELLELPMNGLAVAGPNGPLLTPGPVGPRFNVFVLLPRLVRLQIARVNDGTEITWPTNAGHWVLQFSGSSESGADWTDHPDLPGVEGDRYAVRDSSAQSCRIYRLRAAE